MTNTKKYWKGLAELNNDPIIDKLAQNEFVDELPVDEFFKNVLYDSKFGYYTSRLPFGEKGDFITSPKISSLFSVFSIFIYKIKW